MNATPPTQVFDDGKLTVHEDFVWLLHRCELDDFESFFDERAGKLLREVGPRANVLMTLETDHGERRFFLKRHAPVPLGRKLLSWLRLCRPRTPARVEWFNIQRLAAPGVATMSPVALGEDPLTGRSFIMTAEIDNAAPADDYAREHLAGADAAPRRRTFVRRLGRLVRRLHAAGLTHRDLYLCHVFVRESEDGVRLHLIDLQRLGSRVFARRWRVKDVAQLAYSRPAGTFTRTDVMRFLHAYFDTGGLAGSHRRFVASVSRKVRRMASRRVPREGGR
ncbi:MAG TPA: lipopolysaccharide kinase InaA family protein [Planctomycetota bacterium]|nr:lipopolysaccharide kinase InaA family protein [Planctomycetota bacterium]